VVVTRIEKKRKKQGEGRKEKKRKTAGGGLVKDGEEWWCVVVSVPVMVMAMGDGNGRKRWAKVSAERKRPSAKQRLHDPFPLASSTREMFPKPAKLNTCIGIPKYSPPRFEHIRIGRAQYTYPVLCSVPESKLRGGPNRHQLTTRWWFCSSLPIITAVPINIRLAVVGE
jgi:hypothetical protein